MSKKKIAVILASTALIASLVIGGTLAYLTDTAEVTNTFTMGDVDITLTETGWDADGANGILGDFDDPGFELVPGDSHSKNPTVTSVEGSSYMRVKMEIETTAGTLITDPARLKLIYDTISGWNTAAGVATAFTLDTARTVADTGVYYFNYNSVFTPTSAPATLFTSVAIPLTYTKANLGLMGAYNIVVTAEAIQSDNFTGANAAAIADAAFTALHAGG